jgi:hypothetical protein
MSNSVKPTTKEVVTPVKTLQTVASVMKPLPKEETEKLPPLEDRLLRLNQLFEIQTKYNRLQKSKQVLNEFLLSKDTENLTLELRDIDNRRLDFSTKNSEVIKDVLAFLKEVINNKIALIEPKLNW